MTHYYCFVMIGLVYMAYADACRRRKQSCQAKVLRRAQALALVTHDTSKLQLHVLVNDKQCLRTLIFYLMFVRSYSCLVQKPVDAGNQPILHYPAALHPWPHRSALMRLVLSDLQKSLLLSMPLIQDCWQNMSAS